jgi:polyferredoxin
MNRRRKRRIRKIWQTVLKALTLVSFANIFLFAPAWNNGSYIPRFMVLASIVWIILIVSANIEEA